MAPSSTTSPAPPRLTPEEADQVAARYRPSWELASLAAVGPEIVANAQRSGRHSGIDSSRVATTRLSPVGTGSARVSAASVVTKLDPSEIEETPDMLPIAARDTIPPQLHASATLEHPRATPGIGLLAFAVLGVLAGLATVGFLLFHQGVAPPHSPELSTSVAR